MKFRPDLLANMIEASLFLEAVQQLVDRFMLRRSQGQLFGLELLALQTLDIERRSLHAINLGFWSLH